MNKTTKTFKLVNPVLAVSKAYKKALRDETIFRIKSGNYENGLAPLLKMVTLSSEEVESIIESWISLGLDEYVARYSYALVTGSIDSAMVADDYFRYNNYRGR